MNKFPHYSQPGQKDCGPTCLKIIAKYFGKVIPLQKIRDLCETSPSGSNLLYISEAAEKLGFRSTGARISYQILKEIPLPCIVHWGNNHFVVVYKIKKGRIFISDPAQGRVKVYVNEFLQGWIGNNADENTEEGIILLLEVSPTFYQNEWRTENKNNFNYLFKYTLRYKKLLLQLALGLLGGSLLQFIFPFLTQAIVDVGIKNQNVSFVYLILFAQIMLFAGSITIEALRGWLLLHLSTRINISLISDFFMKLMRLPMSFFDSRLTGDILQRINDHQRIERLLTQTSLSTLFSLFNIVIFSAVLIIYSIKIFTIFVIGSFIYLSWIFIFLKRRKEIDHQRFLHISLEQSKVIELINGMQEIKLHNAEKQKRWSWEFVQVRLFKVAIKSLAISQLQGIGSKFIDQLKNIGISCLSALLVIKGEISLGMMLSIQYIIGQLNSPLTQIVGFIQALQDAQISLERLQEIHGKKDEEPLDEPKINDIDFNNDIKVANLSFRYPGAEGFVLKNLTLKIPANKTTAIVGASGSGKTTLMKLLLGFYSPQKGDIKIGDINFHNISYRIWRANCGVVMQEGYIFNDTIAHNIAVNEGIINRTQLSQAVKIANIKGFIDSLPKSYNTKIGNEGLGLSSGQKQRLLIARAVYKNPEIVFFDEATSALDANNEKIIIENLQQFLSNRTAIVIAHRLSTVKHADQIVVLEKGKIVEIGDHESLLYKQGNYYNLVKNQLEL